MAEKKQSLLALLEILKQYSDEDHLLSIRDMQRHLKNGYGLDIERRTIYAHMDLLRQNGYEISSYDESGKGYYLQGRQFDKGEVLLLCNAVHASHFISARQSDQLVSKLLATQSRYQQQEYRDKVYLANPLKTPNRQLLYTIEIVSEAIRDGRQLQFTYLKYDDRKKLVARRQEPYIVEPRYIVYADSRAYMIVTSLKHPGFIHYRLDRMADAR
ncbi:MAG: WYL domain-containing protein, partial [Erysipelotrichaceae bacterium]|nr:WYL domain-containing protein [Erysipelotrichaceae bacterium]